MLTYDIERGHILHRRLRKNRFLTVVNMSRAARTTVNVRIANVKDLLLDLVLLFIALF